MYFDILDHNPLYSIFSGPVAFAFIIAVIGMVVAAVLLWKGEKRHFFYVIGGSALMLTIAIDMTRVLLHPISSVRNNFANSFNQEQATFSQWTETSEFTTAASVVFVVMFAILLYHAIKRHMLMTAASLFIGFIASIAIAVDMVTYQFINTYSAAWSVEVEKAVWAVLVVGLSVYIGIAVGVLLGWNTTRIQRRTQLDTLTGADAGTEPALRH